MSRPLALAVLGGGGVVLLNAGLWSNRPAELLKVLEAAPVPWRRLSQVEGGAERRMIHASTAAPFPGVTETGVQ